jgi:hypothetical protein
MTEVSHAQPVPVPAGDDWKSRLVLPAKDTRVQTDVSEWFSEAMLCCAAA